MSIQEIVQLVIIIVLAIGLIAVIISDLVKGKLQEYIKVCMAEAEKHEDWGPQEKLNYVLEKVKEKYKVLALIGYIKKIVESVIDISKQINYKKQL